MTDTFEFGENHPGYPVRVLNEREARGAAGIMLVLAIVAFMNAWKQRWTGRGQKLRPEWSQTECYELSLRPEPIGISAYFLLNFDSLPG